MNIQGIIFDMDGLILDTERLYQKFWKEASKQCGYEMSQKQALAMRSLDKSLAKKLLKEFFGDEYDYKKVHDLRVELMAEYISKHGVQAKDGVVELTDYLKENGYKIAIATATNYARANEHLTLAGVRECFENIICASDLKYGKPFPDVYLYACKSLGLSPESCVALEDSPNGIKSAYAAGCVPILVPDGCEPEEDSLPYAYACVKSLRDVPDVLEQLKK